MIELPEAIVIAKSLDHELKDLSIVDLEVFHTSHQLAWMNHPTEYYMKTLKDRVIHQVLQSGGMIRILMDQGLELVLSEDIELGYVKPSDVPSKHQLKLVFSNQMAFYVKVKMYGFMLLGTRDQLNENIYYQRATSLIDPLSTDYDLDTFLKETEMDKGVGSLKSALATKQHIPGLGNGILQDILFHAGLRPEKKVSSMNASDFSHLYQVMKKTLQFMTDCGGRKEVTQGFHHLDGYDVMMHGKTSVCPSCYQEVIKKAYLGGKVIYCPICQKE